MPWWSWVLIWIILALVLLLVLILGAIHLWRRAKALLAQTGRASDELAAAYRPDAAPLGAPADAAGTVPTGWDAAFSDPALVRAARESDRDARRLRRRERRIASLQAAGRPLRWGDLPESVRTGSPEADTKDETR